MKLSMTSRSSHSERGFSLVELLVTIVISLLASLAIFGVLSTYEGKKRTTTFVNDASQSGNFAMFYIDKLVRDSGSGFAQAWQTGYGCQLLGTNSAGSPTTQIFPVPNGTLPPEFSQVYTDTLSGALVLAPVLIDYQASGNSASPNQPSDALIVMSGAGGNAEYPINLTAVPATTALPVVNTVAFQKSELLLLTDASGAVQTPCLLSQVSSSFIQAGVPSSSVPLPLAGTFYNSGISPVAVATYSKGAGIIDLGNPTSDSPPVFDVIGVNLQNTLVDYPILTGTKTSLQVADGVLEMHAVYGVDEVGNGVITNWVAPTGTWSIRNLMGNAAGGAAPGGGGSPGTGAYLLERIKAIRVGLILRTDLPENTKTGATITAGPLTLFSDLPGLTYTRTLTTTAEKGYRYRTVEATIPIRNNLLISQ